MHVLTSTVEPPYCDLWCIWDYKHAQWNCTSTIYYTSEIIKRWVGTGANKCYNQATIVKAIIIQPLAAKLFLVSIIIITVITIIKHVQWNLTIMTYDTSEIINVYSGTSLLQPMMHHHAYIHFTILITRISKPPSLWIPNFPLPITRKQLHQYSAAYKANNTYLSPCMGEEASISNRYWSWISPISSPYWIWYSCTVGLGANWHGVLHVPHYSLWKRHVCACWWNTVFTLCILKRESCSRKNGNLWVTATVPSKHTHTYAF